MNLFSHTKLSFLNSIKVAMAVLVMFGISQQALAATFNLGNLNGKQYNRIGTLNNRSAAFDEYRFNVLGTSRVVIAMTDNHAKNGWALYTHNNRLIRFQPKTSSGQATYGLNLKRGSYKVRVFRIQNYNYRYNLLIRVSHLSKIQVKNPYPTRSTRVTYTPPRTTTTPRPAAPRDQGANTMYRARILGSANQQGLRISDYIGSQDRVDWWAVNIGSNNARYPYRGVRVSLTGVRGNVDLIAYDSRGRVLNRVVHRPNVRVISPAHSFNGNLVLSATMPVGVAYIQVVHHSGQASNYTMEIKGY